MNAWCECGGGNVAWSETLRRPPCVHEKAPQIRRALTLAQRGSSWERRHLAGRVRSGHLAPSASCLLRPTGGRAGGNSYAPMDEPCRQEPIPQSGRDSQGVRGIPALPGATVPSAPSAPAGGAVRPGRERFCVPRELAPAPPEQFKPALERFDPACRENERRNHQKAAPPIRERSSVGVCAPQRDSLGRKRLKAERPPSKVERLSSNLERFSFKVERTSSNLG